MASPFGERVGAHNVSQPQAVTDVILEAVAAVG
jgi:hypothetical protein